MPKAKKAPKKNGWGGKRPNQTGRPTGTGQGRSTKNISVTLGLDLLQRLKERAKQEQISPNKLATQWIEERLAPQNLTGSGS